MKKALVVDDNPENIYLLENLLKSEGYEILTARHGVEALEIARAEAVDVVISDILMPVMDGFTLCREWVGDEKLSQVPFIFYTASYTDDPDREFALSLGAAGHLTKTTEPGALVEALHAILENFSRKGMHAAPLHAPDETTYYRLYNEVLVHKLEQKLSELERVNRLLSKSEANYKFLFDNNPFAMWIFDVETLRFLKVNDAAVAIYGYSREEFLSMTIMDIRPAEDIPALLENVTESQDGFDKSGPWRHRLKNGRVIQVEITSNNLVYEGRAAQYIMVQDITERLLAERNLKESEERVRLALKAADQGLYDLNVQTGDAIVNDEYALMLGYDPKTFKETNAFWISRLHPDDAQQVGEIYRAYIRGEISEYRVEFRQRALNGDWIWILSIGSIVERDAGGHPLRMLGTHTDITASKQLELERVRLLEESQRRLARIGILRNIDQAINSNQNITSTLGMVIEQVRSHLDVDAAAVLLYDSDRKIFRHAASDGFLTPMIRDAQIKWGESLAGKASARNALMCFDRLTWENIDPNFRKLFEQENFLMYCALPLQAKGKLQGVLEVFHRRIIHPDDEWVEFLHTLGGQAAVAIENAQLVEGLQHANQDLQDAYERTIEGWSKAMDLRDKETEGHTLRVTEMTLALARLCNIKEPDLIHIRRGTLLHDIGKMGIPDVILFKSSALDKEERKIIEQHPVYAFEMLNAIDYLRPALEIPYMHHEKWDGTGYPNGLRGEHIPLAARLFAIVDVYDALTSDRPYRLAWSKTQTLDYIRKQSGKHFDPRIVELFLKFIEQDA